MRVLKKNPVSASSGASGSNFNYLFNASSSQPLKAPQHQKSSPVSLTQTPKSYKKKTKTTNEDITIPLKKRKVPEEAVPAEVPETCRKVLEVTPKIQEMFQTSSPNYIGEIRSQQFSGHSSHSNFSKITHRGSADAMSFDNDVSANIMSTHILP